MWDNSLIMFADSRNKHQPKGRRSTQLLLCYSGEPIHQVTYDLFGHKGKKPTVHDFVKPNGVVSKAMGMLYVLLATFCDPEEGADCDLHKRPSRGRAQSNYKAYDLCVSLHLPPSGLRVLDLAILPPPGSQLARPKTILSKFWS
jgi:hypothetical protein